jgi:hypothetical protein
MKLQWELNASTGDYIAKVSDNTRLIRMGSVRPYLYLAEFWGDYSLAFPVRGTCETSVAKALSTIHS